MAKTPKPMVDIAEAEQRVIRRKAQLKEQVAMVSALGRRSLSGPVAIGALAVAGVWAGRKAGVFGKMRRVARNVQSRRPKRGGVVNAVVAILGPRVARMGFGVLQRFLMAPNSPLRSRMRF